MNSEDKKQYIQRLQNEIQETENLLAALKEANKPVSPDDAIGRISRMDAINNKSITDNQVRENIQKLKNLQTIYAQRDSQEFGQCMNCTKDIPLPRLLYLPQVRTCVNCAR